MRLPIRSIAGLTILVVTLAACATTAAPSAEPTAPSSTPSAEPSTAPTQAPAETPTASPEIAGTLTMVDGMAVDGPGESIADALAAGRTKPTLVNGAIFVDARGTIYLASSLTDAAAPTFAGPILEVVGYPENTADFDMAHADVTGLQEANGIRFFETAQLFGVVES
jgi:hypothetical protein